MYNTRYSYLSPRTYILVLYSKRTIQLSQKLISISSQASTMNISPSVLATFAVLSSSGVWVSVKIRTMMWKSLLSLSCTLLRFFSSEKKLWRSKTDSGEGDNETAGKE